MRSPRWSQRPRPKTCGPWTAWIATTGRAILSNCPSARWIARWPTVGIAGTAVCEEEGPGTAEGAATRPTATGLKRSRPGSRIITSRVLSGVYTASGRRWCRSRHVRWQRSTAATFSRQMDVKWGSYPNNSGHTDFPGCFRCHDEQHAAARQAEDHPGLLGVPHSARDGRAVTESADRTRSQTGDRGIRARSIRHIEQLNPPTRRGRTPVRGASF